MKDETELAEDHAVRTLTQKPLGAGRVGTYAILGAAVGSVPFPWVPDLLARRVRGALAQDIAGRHGLSITLEARDILVEPGSKSAAPNIASQAMRFFVRRVLGRFGPLGVLPPIRAGIETFVLGHLLARYLDGARTDRAARIDADEAGRLRKAIDQAIIHVFRGDLHTEIDPVPTPVEELRDPVTQIIDTALITAAGIPGWMVRRLEMAFDEVLPQTRATP